VTPRVRVAVVVGAVAVAAVAAVIGISVLSGDDDSGSARPRAGHPPLSLQLGVRTDPESTTLRRAANLYVAKRYAAAGKLFRRSSSLEAKVGAALSAWPNGSLATLERLGSANPRSGVVQLHLGFGRVWAAKGDARAAFRRAEADPDTPYALTAQTILHPEFARGQPIFVPAAPAPASLAKLAPPAQLATLRRRSGRSVADALRYGVALQRLGKAVSAERVFAAAARKEPGNAEARTAAAFGRFTKDEPVRAFSKLGPLTKTFPGRATVRFHLGLLLLWTGEVAEGRKQLRLAQKAEPGSPLAREAGRLLARIAHAGTG
jgi:hypothetical protein